MFSEGGIWLGNPDAVLQGIQTAGGDPINNGTQGMVVMRLSNVRYASAHLIMALQQTYMLIHLFGESKVRWHKISGSFEKDTNFTTPATVSTIRVQKLSIDSWGKRQVGQQEYSS